MGAVGVIALIGSVFAFLLAVLVQFPALGSEPENGSVGQTAGDPLGAARQTGERLNMTVNSVIIDILSHQKNPDMDRVSITEKELNSYIDNLLPQYQAFITDNQQKLKELTAQAEADAQAEPTPTPTPSK